MKTPSGRRMHLLLRSNRLLIYGILVLVVTVLPSCQPQSTHPCANITCSTTPLEPCEIAYHDALSDLESRQMVIKRRAIPLLNLSESIDDPTVFRTDSANVSQLTMSLKRFANATLTQLNVPLLENEFDLLQLAKHNAASRASDMERFAGKLSSLLALARSQVQNLESNITQVISGVTKRQAELCPANVPSNGMFHFSGYFSDAGSYGAFQLETGAFQNNVFLTFQLSGMHSADGVLLASHSMVYPSTPAQDGFLLALINSNVQYHIICAGIITTVSVPLTLNQTILNTIHVIHTTNTIVLRVNDQAASVPSLYCNDGFTPMASSSIIYTGTPREVNILNVTLTSARICLRTVSIDGVLIVQNRNVSPSSLSDATCRHTTSDVLVFVDTSDSVATEAQAAIFEKFVMQKLSPILAHSTIHVRVAVAQFGPSVNFRLASQFTSSNTTLFDHLRASSLNREIGLSHTGTALRHAAAHFELESHGSGNRLLILITDGRVADADTVNIPVAIEALQQLAVRIVVLGVGEKLYPNELQQLAAGELANLIHVGPEMNLPHVERSFLSDLCQNFLPRLGLFSQIGITNCTRNSCRDYVTHSKLLPDVQTFIMAENFQMKQKILAEARRSDAQLVEIENLILQSEQQASSAKENFNTMVSRIEEQEVVLSAMADEVTDHESSVQMLSSLVLKLYNDAQEKLFVTRRARNRLRRSVNRLRSSVQELTSIDMTGSQLLIKAHSLEIAAQDALGLASSELGIAQSLQDAISSLETAIVDARAHISQKIDAKRDVLHSFLSMARQQISFPNVEAFSMSVSALSSSFDVKVELGSSLDQQASVLTLQHAQQLEMLSDLEDKSQKEESSARFISESLRTFEEQTLREDSLSKTLTSTIDRFRENFDNELRPSVNDVLNQESTVQQQSQQLTKQVEQIRATALSVMSQTAAISGFYKIF